ncbi:hypothetical protein F4779DRAFT_527202 [Xylariaceae sp. FL0662B]|nr:hypothetical protein F4779DRAFT_527202 [Xylariaceae sp. FL0662B]
MSVSRPLANDSPHRPSVPANSETSRASSEVFSFHQPFPSLPHQSESTHQSESIDSVAALPVSRNTRKLVIDSTTITPPRQTIRRKPLSSTASPIAVRFSSEEYLNLTRALPKPEHRFDRAYSVDSPTVYDFPQPPSGPPVLGPVVESPTKPRGSGGFIVSRDNKDIRGLL